MALKRFTNGDKLKADQINYNENTSLLDAIFPIGRGFIDFTNTDYSNYLGFTWERELVGLTPIGYKEGDSDFGTIGNTLGDTNHRHDFRIGLGQYNGVCIGNSLGSYGAYSFENSKYSKSSGSAGTISILKNASITATTSNMATADLKYSDGDTSLASSYQPSQVVAYWKRVA